MKLMGTRHWPCLESACLRTLTLSSPSRRSYFLLGWGSRIALLNSQDSTDLNLLCKSQTLASSLNLLCLSSSGIVFMSCTTQLFCYKLLEPGSNYVTREPVPCRSASWPQTSLNVFHVFCLCQYPHLSVLAALLDPVLNAARFLGW